jgi:protein O-mannosyl-transferase
MGWHIALIGLLSLITFSNALTGSFVWDDEIQIVKNWQIRDLKYVGSAFSTAFWAFAAPEAARTNFYRPVQTLTYMIAYQIGGLSAWPYHLMNILFHTAAGIFLYLLCTEYGISVPGSLFAAAIFVVHPVHTEAVSWNAGTPDVSCGMLYFASIWMFLKYLKRRRQSYVWMAAALFLAACFSKEMAVTLPVVAALLMLAKGELRKTQLAQATRDLFPFFVAGLVYLGARLAALGFLSTNHANVSASFGDWITLGLRVFGQYIHYTLVPFPLTAYHLIPIHLSDRMLPTFLYVLCIVAAAFIVWKMDSRFKGIGLWAIVFAITLIPVFNFKGISLTFFAERYLYIPTLAFAVIAGLLLDKAGNTGKAIAGALVVMFAILTLVRNEDWKSDERLYGSILRVQPEVAHIRNNMADIYLKRGDDVQAAQYLESALQYLDGEVYIQSSDEKYRAHVGLGAIAARARKYPEAKQHLTTALEINPRGDWAYLYLGGVIMEEGDYASAMQRFKMAIDLSPINEVARDYMGIALFNMKKYQEAIGYFQEALKINPAYKDAETHLQMAARALAS